MCECAVLCLLMYCFVSIIRTYIYGTVWCIILIGMNLINFNKLDFSYPMYRSFTHQSFPIPNLSKIFTIKIYATIYYLRYKIFEDAAFKFFDHVVL